jgi:hypothetical protein
MDIFAENGQWKWTQRNLGEDVKENVGKFDFIFPIIYAFLFI